MADSSFEDSVVYALTASHLTLKEEQKRSVQAVYEGNDVFVWLPTGYGKSLCYQVLPLVFDHKLVQRGAVLFLASFADD